jgi:glutamate racemase
MIDLGVDCIILGCTHYPLLLEVIQGTVGTRIQLLDSALWTAKEVQDILTALNSVTSMKDEGFENSSFLLTDITADTGIQAELFLGRKLTSLQRVTLDS